MPGARSESAKGDEPESVRRTFEKEASAASSSEIETPSVSSPRLVTSTTAVAEVKRTPDTATVPAGGATSSVEKGTVAEDALPLEAVATTAASWTVPAERPVNVNETEPGAARTALCVAPASDTSTAAAVLPRPRAETDTVIVASVLPIAPAVAEEIVGAVSAASVRLNQTGSVQQS